MRLTPEHWSRIEIVLDTALELPPEARSVFLDVACLNDDELRTGVEQLLAIDARLNEANGAAAYPGSEAGNGASHGREHLASHALAQLAQPGAGEDASTRVALASALSRLAEVDQRLARVIELHLLVGAQASLLAATPASTPDTLESDLRKARLLLYEAILSDS